MDMRAAFHQQLELIGDELTEMSRLSGQAMRRAIRALSEGDGGLAEQVIAGDAEIDNLRDGLEIRCFDTLALQAPLAGDLRSVTAGLRMVFDLERMGDLAVHIATDARLRHPVPALPADLSLVICQMGELCGELADVAGEMIRTRDPELGTSLELDDDRVDTLHRGLFRTLTRPGAYSAEVVIDATLLARYCERFGDHAVSLGQRVVFLVTGRYPARRFAEVI
jgi:phosphate transport system protein